MILWNYIDLSLQLSIIFIVKASCQNKQKQSVQLMRAYGIGKHILYSKITKFLYEIIIQTSHTHCL